MKLIPILFSTPMVQAIQEGRKTMTRRVIKPKDEPFLKNDKSFIDYSSSFGWIVKHKIEDNPERFEITQNFKCPYGKPGDVLWVRETFSEWGDGGYAYKADGFIQRYGAWERDTPNKFHDVERIEKWKPSIFMPFDACRIFLKVTDVRVELLKDITEQDAIAEGVRFTDFGRDKYGQQNRGWHVLPVTSHEQCLATARTAFGNLWIKINGQQSWDANPYVWVVSFERTEKQ